MRFFLMEKVSVKKNRNTSEEILYCVKKNASGPRQALGSLSEVEQSTAGRYGKHSKNIFLFQTENYDTVIHGRIK